MYKRRIKIFLVLVAVVLAGLLLRIGHLQIVRGERYREEFERSMRQEYLLPASRGQIADRNGLILAADVPCKDFCLDYRFLSADPKWVGEQVRSIQRARGVSRLEANDLYRERADYTWQLADRLAGEANEDLREIVTRIEQSVRRIHQRVQERSGAAAVRVREEQQSHAIVPSLEEESAMEVESDILAGRTVGAVLRPGHRRLYPYGDVACHLIGLTGAVTERDLARENAFPPDTEARTRRREGYEPDDSIGNSGMEKLYEDALRGRRGYRVMDLGGKEPEEVEGEPAEPGVDIRTTLDVRLQKILAERLRETGYNGAAVAISIERGEVLAMASVPTYDLNRYREELARLNADHEQLPQLNRAVAGRYPPGSSVKPLVALAALTTGKIVPSTTFDCAGSLDPRRPWQRRCTGTHGTIDLHTAIMKSCNVYFYHVADRVGLGPLDEWLRLFGLHQRVGTGLPEEAAGHVPPASWIASTEHAAVEDETIQEGIGQGTLLVTPLHMANAMATIARDGRMMSPTLTLESVPGVHPGDVLDLPIPPGALAAVKSGMKSVVGTPGGTGYSAFHAGESLGIEVCGKSGTAQTDNEGTRAVWFEGFAPAERPKVAFAIMLERLPAGTGGAIAAPVAKDLLRWCKEMGYLNE